MWLAGAVCSPAGLAAAGAGPWRRLRRLLSSAAAAEGSPLALYRSRVDSGTLYPDHHQARVVDQLQVVHASLLDYQPAPAPSRLARLLGLARSRRPPPTGLYLWGTVGTGKTMLMDLFFECCQTPNKRRVHFNSFMLDVHRRIHEAKVAQPVILDRSKQKPFDPIAPVANSIAEETWLICFDEFQVTDIADAMILRRLFTKMFEGGVVMIATSNRPPDDLYKNGLQRANFVPFIPILKSRCTVMCLDSGTDYRLKGQTAQQKTYFVKRDGDAESGVKRLFKVLCAQETDVVRARTLNVRGRDVRFERTCGRVADCTFTELCGRPLGAADYLTMSQFFHTVIIRDVPQLSVRKRAEARRFITLIDTLYDRRVRVVVTAEVPLTELFSAEGGSELTDEKRALMDDLSLDNSSLDATSIFTGEEELFAFDRTLSRLAEMQTAQYWSQWEHRLS